MPGSVSVFVEATWAVLVIALVEMPLEFRAGHSVVARATVPTLQISVLRVMTVRKDAALPTVRNLVLVLAREDGYLQVFLRP